MRVPLFYPNAPIPKEVSPGIFPARRKREGLHQTRYVLVAP